MTREEAITVLEGLSDNPLFSNQHKAALNIAIHDIKAYHDWNINNLILINKDNYEPLEQEDILDKIRAEIVDLGQRTMNDNRAGGIWACRDIIDKYKAERNKLKNDLKRESEE